MAYYNYKRVVYRSDYKEAKKELEARIEELEEVQNKGDAWRVVEFLIDKYKARIEELEEVIKK